MKHSRKYFTNRVSVFGALVIVISSVCGCQLKKRDINSGENPIIPPVVAGSDAQSIRTSKNGKFIIKSSADGLVAKANNKITYAIVTSGLLRPSATQPVDAVYRMPNQASVPERKIAGALDRDGKVTFSYDVSEPGLWEIKLVFAENGIFVDELTYLYMPSELPIDVKITKNQKFFVRASRDKLTAGEENQLTYSILTNSFSTPAGPGLRVEAMYWMPTMPEMGKFTAVAISSEPGQFGLAYDISMGGLWEITLNIFENNSQIDEIVYSYNVGE